MVTVLLYEDWCAKGSLGKPIFEDTTSSESGENAIGLSSTLHLIADITACVFDIMEPGSGAIIDLGSLISYILESTYAFKNGKFLDGTLLAISAGIQSIMLFDPLNLGTFAKAKIAAMFKWFNKPTQKAFVEIGGEAAMRELKTTITSFLNRITRPDGIVAKIVDGLATVAKNLGVNTTIITKFLTETVPSAFKTFLQKLASINVSKIGISVGTELEGEGAELVAKTFAKMFTGNIIGLGVSFSASITELLPTWVQNFMGKPKMLPSPEDKSKKAEDLAQVLLRIPNSGTMKWYSGEKQPAVDNAVGAWVKEVKRIYYFEPLNRQVFAFKCDDPTKMGVETNSSEKAVYSGSFTVEGDQVKMSGNTRQDRRGDSPTVFEVLGLNGKMISSNLPQST